LHNIINVKLNYQILTDAFARLYFTRRWQCADKLLLSESLHCLHIHNTIKPFRSSAMANAPVFSILLFSELLHSLQMLNSFRSLRPSAIAMAPLSPMLLFLDSLHSLRMYNIVKLLRPSVMAMAPFYPMLLSSEPLYCLLITSFAKPVRFEAMNCAPLLTIFPYINDRSLLSPFTCSSCIMSVVRFGICYNIFKIVAKPYRV
jgi:hypothetical protein